MKQAQQQEIKRKIKENPEMTEGEKGRELKRLSEPYKKMSDEELLQLVRDFVRECGREPMRKDVLYDRELKYRFGPWTRMLEKAGTRPVAEHYLERKKRRRENASVIRNTAGSFGSSRRQKPRGLKKQRG